MFYTKPITIPQAGNQRNLNGNNVKIAVIASSSSGQPSNVICELMIGNCNLKLFDLIPLVANHSQKFFLRSLVSSMSSLYKYEN